MPTDMIVGNWPIRAGQVLREGGRPAAAGHADALAHRSELHGDARRRRRPTAPKLEGRPALHGASSPAATNGGRARSPSSTPNLTSLDASTARRHAAAGVRGQDRRRRSRRGRRRHGDHQGHRPRARPNALTVPIAAVKQNGIGRRRRARHRSRTGGKVREVPVQTGLTEGSFIEVTKGLKRRRDGDRRGRPAAMSPSSGRLCCSSSERCRAYGEEVEVHAARGRRCRSSPGDFMSIVGPSGSGKSTMLGLLGVSRPADVRHDPDRRAGRQRARRTRRARGCAATRSASCSSSST